MPVVRTAVTNRSSNCASRAVTARQASSSLMLVCCCGREVATVAMISPLKCATATYDCATVADYPRIAFNVLGTSSDVLHLANQPGQRRLGVTEEHARPPVVEQLVFNSGKPGAHAALENDDALGVVRIENRHAVDRRCLVVARRRV